MPNLFFAEKITFKDVIKHGFESIEEGEGFEYIVGKIGEGQIKVVWEPKEQGCFQSAEIDGVDGFGYTLLTELFDSKEGEWGDER